MRTKKKTTPKPVCLLGNPRNLFIAHLGRYVKIVVDEILWVSSEGNYAHIYTKEKQFVNRISLSSLLKLLPDQQFVKIHKCFLVQISAIDVIDKANNEVIVAGQTIPIGRSYKTKLMDGLNMIS